MCLVGAILVTGWLGSGCGGKEPEAPTQAAPADTLPQLIFAGRPLEMAPLPCAAAILVEATTNTILYEQNARDRRAPASIVKMTLELVVMREVEAGKLQLTDSIRTSAWASRIGGSQAYLAEGEAFPLSEMLQAIAIHSANDCCVAIAEHLAGTPEGFVSLMNQEIELLGLEDTHYINVHGLDDQPGVGNYTTAFDISQIARELIRYPHILEWSSTIEAPFRGGAFLLQNTNKLLGRFQGVDGLKTGFTEKAGFCLCATAKRNDLRLISVVMGADSNKHRFDETARLLAAGFNSYTPVTICRAGEPLGDDVPIKGAKQKVVRGRARQEITIVVSRPDDRRLKQEFVPVQSLRAPIAAGANLGTLKVSSGETVLAEIPVVAPSGVAASGFGAWVRGLFSKS